MSNWRAAKIRSVCSEFMGGYAFLKLEYSSTGIPVLAKGDVKPFGRVEHSGSRFISPENSRARGCRLTRPGDLLLTTRDLTQAAEFLGLVGRIPEGQPYAVNQGANVIRLNDLVDLRYFVYWCNGPIYRQYIKSHHVGSTQIHIRKSDFLDAPIVLPPLSEQRAIASILGTLDDKIELNRRMNETLEAMARALFKSWFVDFDPVRAKLVLSGAEGMEARRSVGMDAGTAALFPDGFEDSPLGKIPAGWRIGTIGDIASNRRVTVDPSKIDPRKPYIALDHMPRRSIVLGEWDMANGITSGKFEFHRGEILFGKLRPYFHKVGVAPVDGVCSTDILVIEAKRSHWFSFLLSHLSNDEFVAYTDAVSTGTKMPRTNWKDMSRYEVALPPEPVAARFDEYVRPAIDRILANIHESRTLASIRDTLLPKLLSGRVRVPDTDEKQKAIATT